MIRRPSLGHVGLMFFVVGAMTAAGCTATTAATSDNAGASSSGGASGSSGSSGNVEKPAENPAKAGCAGSAYTETLPTSVSLSDLKFSSASANAYLLSALERRYPMGKTIVEGGLSSSLAKTQGNCIDAFLADRSSAASVLRQASTVVHECGHFYDVGARKGGDDAVYIVRPNELTFTCKDGDTTERGGKTFARSLIKTDSEYAKRKACEGTPTGDCDIYASTYLPGDPNDNEFDSGDQGYSSVLEEATQYVNSLASGLAFKDAYEGARQTERDGILTFLWYIERYVALARSKYPEAYALLSGDPCWRQATLSVWDRAWFYLKATADVPSLEIFASKIEPLVKAPSLMAEIDALRALECK